uniref:WD_REPEATS_REGION domain-containing protein n=1 Tax=Panagrellus redivivus TaxID=6233 RepID=A0A7E4VGK5_PANRE
MHLVGLAARKRKNENKDKSKSDKKRSKSKTKSEEKVKEKSKLPEKSSKKKEKIEVPKVVEVEKRPEIPEPPPVDDYQYEDDFEEYDDDFEEDSTADEPPPPPSKTVTNGTSNGSTRPVSAKTNGSEDSPSPKPGSNSSSRSKRLIESPPDSGPKTPDTPSKSEKSEPIPPKSLPNGDVDTSNIPLPPRQNLARPVSRLLDRMEARQKIGGGHVAIPKPPPQNQRDSASPAGTNRRVSIDFANARHLDHTAASFVDHFRGIIRMEFVHTKLAELAPMNAYDYYMQLFGKGGQVQASAQTGEDATANESQTESAEKEQIWTQCPPSDAAGLGWGRVVETKSAYKTEYFTEETVDLNSLPKISDERFKLFVNASCALISDIIRDNENKQSDFHLSNKSKFAFSAENKVTAITVREDTVAQDRIVVSYYIEAFSNSFFINKSVILEYSLVPDTIPFFCFVADSQVTAVAYGPDNSKILCAGLMDGSCVFYDTAEAESTHPDHRFPWEGTQGLLARVPSYDTSFHSASTKFGQNAALVWIVAIGTGQVDSFQLATMNNRGTILLYTILENVQTGIDPETMSDFGIRPGAKVRVSRPSEVTNPMPLFKEQSLVANCMVINPGNVYQSLIAVNKGGIVNLTRLKEEYTGPRVYNCDNEGGVEVCSLRFSHFDPTIFMAGLSNGNVCIFRITRGDPMLTLYPPNRCKLAVTHVEWSPT